MTVQRSESRTRAFQPLTVPAGASTTVLSASFPSIPGPYAERLRDAAERQIVSEDEFAVYAEEAVDWAEATFPAVVETWPEA